jgi:hypothetical protein
MNLDGNAIGAIAELAGARGVIAASRSSATA